MRKREKFFPKVALSLYQWARWESGKEYHENAGTRIADNLWKAEAAGQAQFPISVHC